MKKRIWFYQLLFSYVTIFLFVSSFLGFIYFQSMNEVNKKEVIRVNNLFTQQVMQIVDSSLKNVDQMMIRELLLNESLKIFFRGNEPDNVFTKFQAVKVMDQMLATSTIIDSIYIVRRKDLSVLSLSSSESLERYGDRQFITPYLTGNFTPRWTGTRWFKEYPIIGDKKVISMVRKASFDSNSNGLMVINISVTALGHLVDQINDNNTRFIHIMDSENEFISEDVSVQTIQEKQRKILSSFTSEYTNWKFFGGTSNNTYHSLVIFMNTWSIFGVLSVIIGLIFFIYATRKNYEPLKRLINKINKNAPLKSESIGRKSVANEFTYIDLALDDLITKSEGLQEQLVKDNKHKRKYIFQEWMESNQQIDVQEWQAIMEPLGLPGSHQEYQIVIAEIDLFANFRSNFDQYDQELLRYVVRLAFIEIAESCQIPIWVEWTEGSQLSVVLQFQKDKPQEKGKTALIVETLRKWIEENLKFTVTIGIGHDVELENLPLSYMSALDTLQYKVIFGMNRRISYDEIPNKGETELFEYLNNIRSMVRSFRLADQNWKETLKLIFQQILVERLARDYVFNLCYYMVYHLDREIEKLGDEFQNVWKTFSTEFNAALNSLETLNQMQHRINELMIHLDQEFSALRHNSKHYELIQEIKEYIEENFTNPDLSLEYLCQRFGIQGSYLSKLFKDETGDKFVNFLISLRMNLSNKLLIETDDSIQVIAERVGYTSAIAFGRVFKKNYGVSPGQYRTKNH